VYAYARETELKDSKYYCRVRALRKFLQLIELHKTGWVYPQSVDQICRLLLLLKTETLALEIFSEFFPIPLKNLMLDWPATTLFL